MPGGSVRRNTPHLLKLADAAQMPSSTYEGILLGAQTMAMLSGIIT
jgi:hypothetical protein